MFELNPEMRLKPLGEAELMHARDGYGDGVVEAGEKDDRVVVLCCDLAESTRSHKFKQRFPERFVEVGVAEQNMAGIAAGMAFSGKIPFISSYAVFSPGRNWDQVRVSICYSKANVKIIGAHAGISVGPDGATHQALEDLAITRVLPNMTAIAPCDYHETRKAVLQAASLEGPVYIRFGREKTPVITTPDTPFTIGKAEVFCHGSDVSIIACGAMVYQALLAAKNLSEKGVSAKVLNVHTLKPLDEEAIISAARETGAVVTVEEHQVIGGLGGAVAELLSKTVPVPVEFVGVKDRFGESGKPEELLEKFGLTDRGVVEAVERVLARKNS